MTTLQPMQNGSKAKCYQRPGNVAVGLSVLTILFSLTFFFNTASTADSSDFKMQAIKSDKKSCPYASNEVQLVEDQFGYIINKTTGESELVRRFTWSNKHGMTVQVISYGATITSIQVPDNKGEIKDVVLGFDDIDGYLQKDNPYFGALIGRVANRIAGGTFSIGDNEYHLAKNDHGNTLHGGLIGFDKVIWETHVEGTKLTLSYLSKDGEEGFPGAVLTQVTYSLTSENQLVLEMKATSTEPTPVNLANHAYFNLGGHDGGAEAIYNHEVSINADKYTPASDLGIPTGEIRAVGGSIYDFRIPRKLATLIPKAPGGGFDNNFCINKGEQQELTFVARVIEPKSGRVLEVHSDQPGVQFYTSNGIPPANETGITGKGGIVYHQHGAFCLETQNYPDAIHHVNFPNSILNPGNIFKHKTVYKFSNQ